MDPMTVLTSIATSLNIVDKFVVLTEKFLNRGGKPHSLQAKLVDGRIQIASKARVEFEVGTPQLNLNSFDQIRFDALQNRVQSYWTQYNAIFGELPNSSIDEKARLESRLEAMRSELCKDLSEMMAISEATLGVPLGDHYTLYTVCGFTPQG